MKSTVILSLVLLLAAPTFSLPVAEHTENEVQVISEDSEQPITASELVKRQIQPGLCIEWLYIMAFTSGVTHAGSDDSHEVSMRLVSGETQTVILPDRPGDDYLSHKGDLWKLSFVDNFRFSDTCVQLSEIASIALEEHSNDGWNIDSVVTFFRDDSSTGNDFHLASVDMDVFQWIDGDDLQSHRRFELNLVI